ncbi:MULTISPECIES: hypothetical protein [Streptomyces]|uniref:Uncharacterized protein n=2 Tax=Streptomyces TaxID=1883 RepID=A0ABU2RKF9_9ACTN|nr:MULTISPECIES: hypothetical protein [unclassified Streptomyces]MDT0429111.1 hypothetical protein [Streptomyces sp. DSM 41770]
MADLPPYRFMALSGSMSPLDVGSAMAMLADYNSPTGGDDRSLTDDGEAIRGLLETDEVIAPGGLCVRDIRNNVTVRPGCCCGLEDWREWLDVADGETLWLGHALHQGLSTPTRSCGCGPAVTAAAKWTAAEGEGVHRVPCTRLR